MNESTLLISLQAAVPLHIAELRHRSPERRVELAKQCADEVAVHGDVLMFGGAKGAAAYTFNSLARGLAIAAYQPGGVTFAGQHWCVDPHAGCPSGNVELEPEFSELAVSPRRRKQRLIVTSPPNADLL